jgi:hypothetical protein
MASNSSSRCGAVSQSIRWASSFSDFDRIDIVLRFGAHGRDPVFGTAFWLGAG